MNTTDNSRSEETMALKTFLCYRSNSPSSEAAAFIFEVLEKDNRLKNFWPALFEEKCSKHIHYTREDVEPLIAASENIIVTIHENFFDDLLSAIRGYDDRCRTIRNNFEGQEEIEQLESARKELYIDDGLLNIAYQELTYAISIGKRLFPVYVGDSAAPLLEEKRKNIVEAITSVLIERFEMEKKEAKRAALNFFSYINVPTLKKQKSEDGKSSFADKEMLIAYLVESKSNPSETPEAIALSQLKDHLTMIFNTVDLNKNILSTSNNEADVNAYYRLGLNKNVENFCITSAYMNGVRHLKSADDKVGPGRGFFDVKSVSGGFPEEGEIGRDTDYNYCYWPLNLSLNSQDKLNEFNVCAICFGAIIMKKMLTADKNSLTEEKISEATISIHGAMNLLLTLRDYLKMSWMSKWSFSDKSDMYTEGTINQTTLTLSTLIICGFLDCDDTDKLINRYLYLYHSICWLNAVSTRTPMGRDLYRKIWTTMGLSTINLSLTLFSLDTFVKYYDHLVHSTICSDKKMKPIALDVKNDICEILRGLKNDQTVLTLLKKAQPADLSDILNLSKLLKSLYGISELIEHVENCDSEYHLSSEEKKDVLDLMRKAFSILSQADCDRISNANLDEVVEYFPYNGSLGKEKDMYENCIELLFADAIIVSLKALKTGILPKNTVDASLKKAKTVLNAFIVNNVESLPGEYILIKGRNEALRQPIFAYYYYRMVIDDYLTLEQDGEES